MSATRSVGTTLLGLGVLLLVLGAFGRNRA
jgi:hypothetical protein